MELEHLLQAIEDCDNGEVGFNNGQKVFCFLHNITWYPVHPVVNQASKNAIENIKITTNRAIKELHELLPFVITKSVAIENNELADIQPNEALELINHKANTIKTLSE